MEEIQEMKKGKYIVVEGIDGSGKTSVINRLIRDYNNRLIVSKMEPRLDTKFGRLIRDTLRENSAGPDELQMLFSLDRMGCADNIKYLLDTGHTVLSDRSYISGLVYSDSTFASDITEVLIKHDYVVIPDVVILLNVDPRTALSRINSDNERVVKEVFEEFDNLTKVSERYLNFIRSLRVGTWSIIDANKSLEDVVNEVKCIIEPVLGK